MRRILKVILVPLSDTVHVACYRHFLYHEFMEWLAKNVEQNFDGFGFSLDPVHVLNVGARALKDVRGLEPGHPSITCIP